MDAETHHLMSQLNAEIRQWKRVASYLAECHAATLEDLPNSTPKSRRFRIAEICRKSAMFLGRLDSPPGYHGRVEDGIPEAITRCQRSVELYGKEARDGR